MRSVIPWSFSSWDAYQTCPYRFYKTKLTKEFVEAPTQPLIWGNEVHSAIEHYIRSGTPVPDVMQRFIPIVDRIANAPGENFAELQMACDINMQPCEYWGSDTWCWGKGDLVKVNNTKGLNVDWKTGKWKAESPQLDLATVLMFGQFPSVDTVTTLFMYFQEPSKPVSKTFQRSQIPQLLEQFMPGVRDMQYSEQTGVWPKKPSGLCKQYCPVKDCEYHGKGSPRRY